MFHIMNHATFKASLFMAAGIVDHETGTRDIRRLSGLIRAHAASPGSLALVASAAMAGVPLLNGFLSKEMFFAETVFLSVASAGGMGLAGAGDGGRGVFAVVYSLRFGYDIFFGPPSTDLPREPEEAAALDAHRRSSSWCSSASSSASRRRCRSDRRWRRRRARWSAGCCPSTASRSGTASTRRCVMSLVAIGGGIALLPLAAHAAGAGTLRRTRRCSSALSGRRLFESVLLGVTRGARRVLALAARGGCSRRCS